VAERFELHDRHRLLARLAECLARGLQDPELLYLGGRYAASLGLNALACRFLDPLSTLLHEDGRPAPAFFPVGLLYLGVVEPAKREIVLEELRQLAAASPHLTRILHLVGGDAQGRLLAGSPPRLLQLVERYCSHQLWQEFAAPTNGNGNLTTEVQRGAQEATRHYEAGQVSEARRALENILLCDGDQPEALRNLITITSEQHDMEAYCRYWRRYVKLLLWRIMRGDHAAAAYDDLCHFYVRVATITDREFNESPQKTPERLRTPGLLARWLEAHAGLVWLDSWHRPHRDQQAQLGAEELKAGRLGRLAVLQFWCQVFYPEFYPFLDLGSSTVDAQPHCVFDPELYRAPDPVTAEEDGSPSTAGTDGKPKSRHRGSALPFDPAERLWTRFAQWFKFHFGLRNNHDAHAETVTALAGLVARVPHRPYARKLAAIFAHEELNPPPYRRAVREACSLPLRFRLGKFLEGKKPNWLGLLACFGDADLFDCLTPDLRLFLALACCHQNATARAMQIACETLPDMEPDDFEEEAQNGQLWKNVLHANLQAIMEGKEAQRQEAFARLTKQIEAISVEGPQKQFRQDCLKLVRDAEQTARIHEQVDRAVKRSKELVKQNNFDEAVRTIRELPNEPEDLQKLKASLLEQVAEARKSAELHKRIEHAIEQSKKLVGEGKFREAKDVVHRLPSEPADLEDLKRNLLGQIDEAEQQKQLHKRIEAAVEESKKLVGKGKFREAKDVVRRLPDEPQDLKDLKRNLLGQIDEAEQHGQVQKRIEAAVEESKKLVGKGKFREAKDIIRQLPDQPSELKELKKNFLGQIEQVEQDANKIQAENKEILSRLSRRNIDWSKVGRIASDNNVDMSNPFAFNSLLKAIDEQLRGR
jgi:hypothetical protein